MKCVQDRLTGEIYRFTNETAEHNVRSGAFRYVPKRLYKAQEAAKKAAK